MASEDRITDYFREEPDLNEEPVSEDPNSLQIFLTDEQQRIDVMADTEESFREWYAHYVTLTPKQQALADYLGVERSAMSAELGKLVKDGVIACERRHFRLL